MKGISSLHISHESRREEKEGRGKWSNETRMDDRAERERERERE